MAHNYDLPVTAFGLKADVYRHLFAGSQRMIELADRVVELQTAVRCSGCGDKPNQNGRYVNGLFDTNSGGEVVNIDGADEEIVYDVFCNDCYDEEAKKAEAGIVVAPKGI